MPRPTDYTPELGKKICEIVATTRHGLKKLCTMYDYFPEHITIAIWRVRHPEFASLYLQAKQSQMDIVMEELDEVVDENLLYYTDDKGTNRIDSPSATIAIAKANNKKWFASKIAPKLYGDHKQIENLTDENQKIKQELSDLRKQLDAQNKKEY